MSKLMYRPDIDGLRALAVLSVILFHINHSWLPNGFLGVDMFFVISGFLITSILLKDMEVKKFSFSEFYNRRIKRILPVFFVVLTAGVLATHILFVPQDRDVIFKSVIASVMFLANIYFSRQGDYFDVSSNEKPFLHIWSLSLEEQFYFVFPVFLLILFQFSLTKRYKLQIILGAVVFLFLTSFYDLSNFGLNLDNYYLPHARGFELLIGSALAIFTKQYPNRIPQKWTAFASTSAIFSLIVLLFVGDIFPNSILFLLTCLSVSLLIFSNQNSNFVSKFFSLSWVVWIGKISYSLYLWHWVILALMRYYLCTSILPTNYWIIAVLLTFLFSIITYYGIEQPFRKKDFPILKSVTIFYFLPAIFVLSFAFISKNKNLDDLEFPDNICHSKFVVSCLKGDITKEPDILFIGNSHTGQLNPFVDEVGKKEGWSADVVSTDSAHFAFDYYSGKNPQEKQRNQWIEENYHKYKVIVLTNYAGVFPEPPVFEETIERFLREGKDVYIIDIQKFADNDPLRYYYFKSIGITPYISSIKPDVAKENYMLPLTEKYPEIRYINLKKYVPDNFFINGKPIIKDKTHLNIYGAKYIAQEFMKENVFYKNSK
ncbi:acyltransferase family protein [Capnocytophaga cynodegmi]|uniref:acyltransferase family protein n=1 Tax=Capnocytophaga cynodegmi TaxID=28189 RepID=UPI00385F089F